MKFTATDADAVRAAHAAVLAAERTRAAECGNGDPKQRGLNCRLRETEETTARNTEAAVVANKALADQAAKLDSEAGIRARLASAPTVKEGNSLGEALGHLLPMSAVTAATAQQGLISAIVEMLIAAAMTLPELLRERAPVAKNEDEPEIAPSVPVRRPLTIAGVRMNVRAENVVPMVPRQPKPAVIVGRHMLKRLARAADEEVPLAAIYSDLCPMVHGAVDCAAERRRIWPGDP
jgi:hypothetical protein